MEPLREARLVSPLSDGPNLAAPGREGGSGQSLLSEGISGIVLILTDPQKCPTLQSLSDSEPECGESPILESRNGEPRTTLSRKAENRQIAAPEIAKPVRD